MIECVSADGTAIWPSVVFKRARQNLEWGRDNPCDTRYATSNSNYYLLLTVSSISHSPKGWTDQELGSAWLECDFKPTTAARNKTGGYRLLILDGHNSHTTYRFCSFVEKHKIIVLCLPPHTTHRLQPCNVRAFGPLNSTWKAEINLASQKYLEIRKNNLISHYAKAREKAFMKSTIQNAFCKCGIWPFNPKAIKAM